MQAKIIEIKLQHYLDLLSEAQGDIAHGCIEELNSLGRELSEILGVDPAIGYEQIVTAASKAIDQAREAEEFRKHRDWLASFHPRHLRNWERVLRNHPEGAKCEMLVRALLEENGNRVEPNLDMAGHKPSPDFRCTQNDKTFFAEVTSLDTDRVTNVTALQPRSEKTGRAFAFGDLNEAIFAECIEKTPQCANLEHPTLIAIGLFHFQASALCVQDRFMRQLLTGKEYITYDLKGEEPAYISTKLEESLFIKPHKQTRQIASARNPVSGILVCGFGCATPEVCGVLNSRPIHHFDRTLLPKIPFYRLRSGYESGSMLTEAI